MATTIMVQGGKGRYSYHVYLRAPVPAKNSLYTPYWDFHVYIREGGMENETDFLGRVHVYLRDTVSYISQPTHSEWLSVNQSGESITELGNTRMQASK